MCVYLADVLCHEAAHDHAVCVDKQVGLGLSGGAEGELLEAELAVCQPAHLLQIGRASCRERV